MPKGLCIEWGGTRDKQGYGHLFCKGRNYRVCRLAVIDSGRELPADMVVDHLCKNPPCVNPDHLEVVTNKENLMRGDSFSGINKNKTHCKRGHALAGDNLYLKKTGARNCKACIPIVNKERAARYAAGQRPRKWCNGRDCPCHVEPNE